jgi:alpha-L-fucosidase
VRPYTSEDIRFTAKGDTLYAFCMDKPTGDINITSLGKKSATSDRKVISVVLLGSDQKLKWKQQDNALVISGPSKLPDWHVMTFRLVLR